MLKVVSVDLHADGSSNAAADVSVGFEVKR